MTNWQLIITLATPVFAIFGANWLNQQMMKSYPDARFDAMNAKLDALRDGTDARFDTIQVEIRAVNQRIDQLDQRVGRIERQLEAIFKPSLLRS